MPRRRKFSIMGKVVDLGNPRFGFIWARKQGSIDVSQYPLKIRRKK